MVGVSETWVSVVSDTVGQDSVGGWTGASVVRVGSEIWLPEGEMWLSKSLETGVCAGAPFGTRDREVVHPDDAEELSLPLIMLLYVTNC